MGKNRAVKVQLGFSFAGRLAKPSYSLKTFWSSLPESFLNRFLHYLFHTHLTALVCSTDKILTFYFFQHQMFYLGWRSYGGAGDGQLCRPVLWTHKVCCSSNSKGNRFSVSSDFLSTEYGVYFSSLLVRLWSFTRLATRRLWYNTRVDSQTPCSWR